MRNVVSVLFRSDFKPNAVGSLYCIAAMIYKPEYKFPNHEFAKLSLDFSLFRPLLRQVFTNVSPTHHLFQFHLQPEFLQILVQLCFGLRNLCLQPLDVALDYINVHQLFFLEHVHIARNIQVEVVAADLLE